MFGDGDDAEAGVKAVRVAGVQRPAVDGGEFGMGQDGCDQGAAEAAAAMPGQHEDVGQMRRGGAVGDQPGEAGLAAGRGGVLLGNQNGLTITMMTITSISRVGTSLAKR